MSLAPTTFLALLAFLQRSAQAMTRGTSPRVGVVGAGAAGLVSAQVLTQHGCTVTVFEKADSLGGTWRYLPRQSVMYASLRTNLPKEIMAFSPEDPFPPSDTSFLGHEEVLMYLESFADKYSLHKLIRFNTEVVNIDQSPRSDAWVVSTNCSTAGPTTQEHELDYVLVCNGHYNTPFVPNVDGVSSFKGWQLHSSDYDQPSDFVDQKVLIVGGKSSGTDLAREISSHASEVHVSDRNHGGGPAHHGKITLHGEICRFTADHVVFNDGSAVCVDSVVWCTGFLYDFPFLKNSKILGSFSGPTRQVRGLYRLLLANEYPSVAFVGLPYSVVPFPIFYLQAKWISSLISGKAKLPPLEERARSAAEHEAYLKSMGWFENKYHYLGNSLQFEYMRFLAREAGADSESQMRYVDTLEEIYFDNSRHKPAYIGGPDSYRGRKYSLERYGLDFSFFVAMIWRTRDGNSFKWSVLP